MMRRAAFRVGSSRGFTLIELIVAFAIVTLALTIVPGSVGALTDSMQYRAAVNDVLSGLRATRSEAMRTGREASFSLDVTTHDLEFPGRGRSRLPQALELGLVVAEGERVDSRGSIRFYPDGSSTGGSVIIKRPSGQGVRLRVDWLLGKVTQESLGT